MTFELQAHTADIAVEATASTLSELFAAVASGLTAAHCESLVDGGETFELTVTAESREALLFDYLDELIYRRDVEEVLPADHDVTIDDEWSLTGTFRGIPLDALEAREIKAVTYSEMEIEETADGWRARVVFDV